MGSINEKSKLIKIIQNEQLTEEDKEELRHILSKLPSEELKSLLGKIYELFIKNYVNILDSRESTTEIVNSENEQKVIKKTDTSFPLNVPNFKEKTMNEIRRLVPLLEATDNQKELILEKTENILDQHISRAIRNEITISKNSNPSTNAAAIIYAVLKSHKNMPNISGGKLSEITGVTRTVIPRLYNTWFRGLAQKLDFNFVNAHLGMARKIISLYLFELLLNEEINTSKIVSRLREIIISDMSGSLTQKERQHFRQLAEKDDKWLKDMANSYPDIFTKYFSDLVNIIRLLIILIKSHKIIGADLSVPDFARFLMSRNINLFSTIRSLVEAIGYIFDFLKDSKYPYLFPSRTYSQEIIQSYTMSSDRVAVVRRGIIGARIKLYLMKHFHNGDHFDKKSGIAICPECKREGLTVNTSAPIIKGKEYHHKGTKKFSCTAEGLFKLFSKDRGNPYFLPDLINKANTEDVELLCRCHHSLLKDSYFNYFKRLICWENIPREFPQDLFNLPAEIINMLIWICVDNSYSTKEMIISQKIDLKDAVSRFIKKKFIIDVIYKGRCPICNEFNTKDHLLAFSFNHLHLLRKVTSKESEMRFKNLYKLPCSAIVRELESQIGAFICGNCHMFFHTNILRVDKIFDDPNMVKIVKEGIERVNKKFRDNLIHSTELIKDPLKLDFQMKKAFIDYFFAFSDILKEKKVININNLMSKIGVSSSAINSFFNKRKHILERYGNIIKGKSRYPTEYNLNDYGKTILRLLQYFKNYYENLKQTNSD